MFRQIKFLKPGIRSYHDSNFRHEKRAPVVKFANARLGRVLRDRIDRDATPKVKNYDPSTRFQPFPYKVTEENKSETLRTVITPLHKIDYEEQLSSKESFCRNAMRLLARELYNIGTPVRMDVRRLPCHVLPIKRAPKIFQYRNKNEYSIWRGLDGETPTVGYLAFSIARHGDTVCIEPNDCLITHPEILKCSDLFQDFIRNHAKLPVSYDLGTDGGWRRFAAQANQEGEVMLIGIINPRMLKVQQFTDERDNFKDYMVPKAKELGVNLKSLYIQACPQNRCMHREAPFELIHGEKSLQAQMNGLKFMISPETYFPPNLSGGEVLYQEIKKIIKNCFMADSDIADSSTKVKKPLIIDATCGAGMLAMQVADLAHTVIGIDISSQAIEDSIANAKLNNINNANFYNLNLDIGLERLLEKHARHRRDTLVVCSPTKTGLRNNVVEALRECEDVTKIVYITQKADAEKVQKNLIDLCRRKKDSSCNPFVPILAAPVDLHPHVDACELIIALERLPKD